MQATIVTTEEELQQILSLSHLNIRNSVSATEQFSEGFITWNYSYELLKKMQDLHPHIIIKEDEKVLGYALVALKEARYFHRDLEAMIRKLESLQYNGDPLSQYQYYVMGQVCIDKACRGKGLFAMLYQKHKELFQKEYDFVITEISAQNSRSLRAHEKIGFETIHTYRDDLDEWNVVLWDWR
jgi:L-amino acid N-acyltransferase YncA